MVTGMSSQLWIRNPGACIREVIEAGESHITFHGGYLSNRGIKPEKFFKKHFPPTMEYEYLIIDDYGSRLYNQEQHDEPLAVYSTWNAATDEVSLLEELASRPVGEDEKLCSDESIPIDQRPVFGQRNLVVVHNLPAMTTMVGKQLITLLRDIQLDYDVELYLHGLYGFMPIINMGFAAFDFEPRKSAMHSKVYVPPGREVKIADIHRHAHWLPLLGYTAQDLQVPRNRCIFNIKAARWATLHGSKAEVFATKRAAVKNKLPDPVVSDRDFKPAVQGRPLGNLVKILPTDKVDCDTCSLKDQCKLYREGSVCTLPDSEMKPLADMFNTTDSKTILAGLGRLTSISATRVERAMAFEVDFGIDPEVSRLIRQTFEMAERYAKLNDPTLRATLNVNRNLTAGEQKPGPAQLSRLDSKAVARQAIEYFTELGISQSDITSDMMRDYLAKVAGIGVPVPAIDAGTDNEPVEGEIVDDGA